MRHYALLSALSLLALAAFPAAAQAQMEEQGELPADSYVDADPSALTDFRPVLDDHGTWVDDESYGTVWAPNATEVGTDFTPYASAGHWLYEDDYVWASDYAWGWVPFHYGRWVFSGVRGWVWIPGRTYAGAWVVWRVSEDGSGYIGWAPMAPVWIWMMGMPMGVVGAPQAPYVFAARDDVFTPGLGSRVVKGEPAAAILPTTHPYVKAAPTVGRHVIQASMLGPNPAALGIDASRVPHAMPDDRRVRRALVFARPSTAVAAGARPPVAHPVRLLPARVVIPQAPAMRAAPHMVARPHR